MEESSCLMAAVGEHVFAIPLPWIRSIVQTPEILSMPQSPDHVRGSVNILDGWLSLVDMRRLCGLRTMQEERQELIDALRQHRQEHEDWFETLEQTVHTNASVALGRSEACRFGLWISQLEPPSPRLELVFRHFKSADDELHAASDEVRALLCTRKPDEAKRRLDEVRRAEMHRLREIFARAEHLLDEAPREVTVAIEADGAPLAIAVDSVHRVETVASIDRSMDQPIAKYGEQQHAILLERSFLQAE